MLKTFSTLGAAVLLGATSTLSLAQDTGTIDVTVTDIKSTDGQIIISLFKGGEGFPAKEDNVIKKITVKPESDTVTGSFEDVAYGTYAVIAHHDEDGNGKMKTVYGTMPIEGLGISNDAEGSFGPPKFKDAKFDLDSEGESTTFQMRY